MPFGLPAITDFCFLVEDVEKSARFYEEKMGFELRTRAEGFADFTTKDVAIALWEIDHIAEHTGISNLRSGPGVHKAVAAIEVYDIKEVDELYEQLLERGVTFISPPKDYPWRARCVYFTDPDDNLWEIYAWLDDKRFGEIEK